MPESPTFRALALDELHFDPQNPRLPETIDPDDLDSVLTFMLDDAGLPDLMGSIAKQGFFPGEPLLISPNKRGPGFIVVEGNRRFAACLLLSHPELAPIRKRRVAEVARTAEAKVEQIPCLLFSDRNNILVHLGYRHVTGIKEWDPLAKARFLEQQYREESGSPQERFRSLAKSIGSRSDYVGRLLASLNLYRNIESNDYFGLSERDAASIEFSLISSLLAYTNVVEYLGLSSSQDTDAGSLSLDNLGFLTKFVFDKEDKARTRLGESRNIGTLAEALAVPRAREALISGASLATATKLVGSGSAGFRSLVAGATENVQLALEQAPSLDASQEDIETVVSLVDATSHLERAIRTSVATGLSK